MTYMIFDLLWLDGHSLMELPYAERRELLAALALCTARRGRRPSTSTGRGRDVLQATAEQQLEGIVAKRLDSTYEPGARTSAWVKIKNVGRQELVIGGWLPGRGTARAAHRRAAGRRVRADGALRYAGRVGTGFSDAELDRLGKLLAPLRREDSPFTAGERPPRGAVFCEPELVAEIEFSEWTARGQPAPPLLQGPARGQAGARSRARGRARSCARRTRMSRTSLRPRAAERAGRAGDPRAAREQGDDDGRRPRAEAVEPRQAAVSAGRASASAT